MANFPRLDELAVAANYRGLFNGMLVYFDRENGKGLDFANGLHDLWAKLLERTNERYMRHNHKFKRYRFREYGSGLRISVDASDTYKELFTAMGPMFTTSLFLGAHKAPAVKLVDNERTQKRSDEWALAKKQEGELFNKKNAANRKLIFNRAKEYTKDDRVVYGSTVLVLDGKELTMNTIVVKAVDFLKRLTRRGNKDRESLQRVYGIPYLDKEGLKNLETHLLTFTIFGLLVLISFSTKKKLSTQPDPEFTFQFLEEFELCDSYVVCEANREDTCHNLSQQPKTVDTQGQMYRNSVGQKRKRPGVQTRCGKRRSIDQRLPGHTTVTEAVRSSSARAEGVLSLYIVIGDFSGPVQIAMQNYGTVST
ncbi:hypothetical protein Tco_1328615 [Tanacetum coccineum]